MSIEKRSAIAREARQGETGPGSGGDVRSWGHEKLRALCLEAGADDVGFVEIDRPGIASERESALQALPGTRTLISYVVKMNREPLRSVDRSVANLEFHHQGDEVNRVGRRIVERLQDEGIRAINPAMGFPMDASRWPGRMWVISHKVVAVEAGLGRMGIHRNLIHPRFGNFVLLGTVLAELVLEERDRPIDYDPCLECKLCVAVCPTGAIKSDGHFDFQACYTHNYREFMGGFGDWVEGLADSRNRLQYRKRFADHETVSMWQSLSYGANYKAAYCLSVCPAGEKVISPWLEDPGAFRERVVAPLRNKEEEIYVIPGSDAEAIVPRRFPAKRTRSVRGSLRPTSIDGFARGLALTFQRDAAKGLEARYHFRFRGESDRALSVTIAKGELTVEEGLVGKADVRVSADARSWLRFLRRERSLVPLLLLGRVRVRGSLRLLQAFGRCFPA